MTNENMWLLNDIHLAPYMQIATTLIGKSRESGGNMFRHQLDTMSILIDYGYIEPVLLKASVVHDLIEDCPNFDIDRLLSIDHDSHAVYELVMEVSKRQGEKKSEFLTRILRQGSRSAKVLKSADRISNMISLGYVNDPAFVQRYTDETVDYIYPIAQEVDKNMLFELTCLVDTRRKGLQDAKVSIGKA
ncbi:MAG: hypothetical protein Ta2G_11750 [Termitinemataceae bacterium]|nr:MAG: hypothetical protein Ta2G_11750 [Termitinemataceae bacterium]